MKAFRVKKFLEIFDLIGEQIRVTKCLTLPKNIGGIIMFSVDHYAISVKKMDESVKFYKELEFKIEKEWTSPDGSLDITHMKNENFILELFCYRKYTNMPETAFILNEDLPVIGSKHIGLYVEDLEKTQDYLLSKRIIEKKTEIKSGRLGRRYFFISDPNGILLEIIEKEGR